MELTGLFAELMMQLFLFFLQSLFGGLLGGGDLSALFGGGDLGSLFGTGAVLGA